MNRRKTAVMVIFVVLALLVSNSLTYSITSQIAHFKAAETILEKTEKPAEGEEAAESRANDRYALFFRTINIIKEKYIETIDEDLLIYGAIDGMLETLQDPQTNFLRSRQVNDLLTFLKGSFGGIGVQIQEANDRMIIIEILPGSPADEEGLHPGDSIYEIDGISMAGKSKSKAVEFIRGEVGSKLSLKVQRPGKEEKLLFTLERREITFQTVSGEFRQPGIAYIKISQFDGHTGGEFLNLIEKMEKQGIKGLILDLRDNIGGILGEALTVAKKLVPKGEITRVVDRDGAVLESYYSQAEPKPYPIVVLINERTASGAEILAGALQDRGAAKLVGEPTYGKATVQHFERFASGEGLRYTVAKYVTPSGQNLHDIGLTPDYKVEMPRIFYFHHLLSPGIMEEGDYGETVYFLQSLLQEIGYDVRITGLFDRKTTVALKEFQKKNNLSGYGRFDDLTWLQLYREMELIVKDKDLQLKKALELVVGGQQ